MTTKAPSATAEFAADSLEKIAYASVTDVPVREVNDRNRLGYSIWAWLKDRKGPLENAVRAAGIRTDVPEAELVALIRKNLLAKGVNVG